MKMKRLILFMDLEKNAKIFLMMISLQVIPFSRNLTNSLNIFH